MQYRYPYFLPKMEILFNPIKSSLQNHSLIGVTPRNGKLKTISLLNKLIECHVDDKFPRLFETHHTFFEYELQLNKNNIDINFVMLYEKNYR